MSVRARAVAACLAVAVAACAAAGAARADADPASDILASFPVFYPYGLPASKSVQARLEKAVKQAETDKRPIKVAMIAAREDLGGVPTFFRKPQLYARFLAQEIGIGYFEGDRTRLLVVMPNGFGLVAAPGIPTTQDLASLRAIKTGETTDELATAAATAVERLNARNPRSSPAASPWRDRLLIIAGVGVVLALAVGLNAGVARARRGRPAPDG